MSALPGHDERSERKTERDENMSKALSTCPLCGDRVEGRLPFHLERKHGKKEESGK